MFDDIIKPKKKIIWEQKTLNSSPHSKKTISKRDLKLQQAIQKILDKRNLNQKKSKSHGKNV